MAGLLILLGLICSILPVQQAHQWLHHAEQDAVTHTADNESDPCHVRLYHHEAAREAQCAHEEHLLADSTPCVFCPVILPGLWTIYSLPGGLKLSILIADQHFPEELAIRVSGQYGVVQDRGPPKYLFS